jgi:hypothetical protein
MSKVQLTIMQSSDRPFPLLKLKSIRFLDRYSITANYEPILVTLNNSCIVVTCISTRGSS